MRSLLSKCSLLCFDFFGFYSKPEEENAGEGYGGEADTYYIRADGTAEKASATDPDAANTSMSVATHNAAEFAAGDTIRISDQGGVIRATLTPPTDGASGNVITYEAVPGESPVISAADVNSSWALQSQEVGYAVYRGGPGSSSAKYNGARDDGTTERNPRNWEGSGTTWANYTVDRMFHGSDGTGYYYIRTDGTAQNPGAVEIGIRQRGIDINNKDYITIDGIDLTGPQGRPDGTGVIKDCSLIDFRGGSTYGVIQNSNLSYGIGAAVRLSNFTTANISVLDNVFNQNWGAIYGYMGTAIDHNVLISGNQILNTSTTIDSEGDRFPIGLWRTRGVTITKNYIYNHGYTGMPGDTLDYAITLAGGWDFTITYNHILSVGRGGISWGMDTTDTASNILIMGNVIDDYAKYPVDAANDIHAGIAIKNYSVGAGATVDGVRIFNNTITGANDPGAAVGTGGAHAGLYINGTGQTNDNFYWSNNIIDDVVVGDMEYGLYVNWGSCTNRGSENNCIYGSGDTISSFGTDRTVAEYNTAHAWAAGNMSTDPELTADYHLGVDLTGDDLGDSYDDGLDEDTTWSPLSVVTADWDTYGWNPGAFVYGTD